MNLRESVFSGSWYPAGDRACRDQIHDFLIEGKSLSSTIEKPVGGIVPHAGWYFSGSIACNVIHRLSLTTNPDTVVVFGMHLHPGSPRYIMPEGQWETPFGPMNVDISLADALIHRHTFEIETPTRFHQDNTIELQMPFIRYFFKNAKVVAMGVPPNVKTLEIAKSVVEVSRDLGRNIVAIGSTDLTHYGPNYGFTSKGTGPKAVDWVKNANDRRIIDAMLRMEPETVLKEGLANENACCSGAAAAAITVGKALGATQAGELVYATSYDKSPGDSFVGYVGVLF